MAAYTVVQLLEVLLFAAVLLVGVLSLHPSIVFLGGGLLEVSGRAEAPAGPNLAMWLQVRDVDAAHDELAAKGVTVLRPPVTEPWGLREMWVSDPDGLALAIIEVPVDHPLRRR